MYLKIPHDNSLKVSYYLCPKVDSWGFLHEGGIHLLRELIVLIIYSIVAYRSIDRLGTFG
jgi:hypothetical protein